MPGKLAHNNIAKIKLNNDIVDGVAKHLKKDFGTIDIVDKNNKFSNPETDLFTVYGYGIFGPEKMFTTLRRKDMKCMSGVNCKKIHKNEPNFNETTNMCLTCDVQTESDVAYNEDFGGPVVSKTESKVVAIITYALSAQPTVITPLAPHNEWLSRK